MASCVLFNKLRLLQKRVHNNLYSTLECGPHLNLRPLLEEKKRKKKTRNDKVREKKLQQLLVPSHEPQKNVIEKKVRSEKNGVRVEQSQEN